MKIDTSAVLKTIAVRKTSEAWSRLMDRCREKGGVPAKLHTNTFEGTLTCIKIWLELNNQEFYKRGNVFEIEYVLIEVVHPEGPSKTQLKRREEMDLKNAITVSSLAGFLEVFDDNF